MPNPQLLQVCWSAPLPKQVTNRDIHPPDQLDQFFSGRRRFEVLDDLRLLARVADQGKDVSRFFKGQGRMVQPIQRVNVDVTAGMLEELDRAAQDLNISRQAVIKTLVRQALDQHDLAQRARRPQPAS